MQTMFQDIGMFHLANMRHTSNDVSNEKPEVHRTAAVELFLDSIDKLDAAVKKRSFEGAKTNLNINKLLKGINKMY